MVGNSADILHDFFPILRVYSDGSIERIADSEFIPASIDQETGVRSKDICVAVDQEHQVSARLYLPGNINSGEKLPLLVYFHGGAFVSESAFSSLYHRPLNMLVVEANILVVSVEYRLAPEHPLPAAYEDSWVALKWIVSHSNCHGSDPWLNNHADFDRVFLGGDSAGANIAHNMAVKARLDNLDGLNLNGIFLNCPYFWGKQLIGDEASNPGAKSFLDKLWFFICPSATTLDDPRLNPGLDPNLARLGCKSVLVYIGEKDPLKYRGLFYKDMLVKSGWVGEVEVVEAGGGEHVFSLLHPTSENAMALTKRLAYFINHKEA